MTSNLTPDPAIHNVPTGDSDAITLADAEFFLAQGAALLNQVANYVALALLNITILGIKPFAALQAFGQDPAGVISTAIFALGGSGSGIVAFETALRNIPGANIVGTISAALISGVTTADQAILDAIANALGHSGTGHTAAQVQGYLANIPGSLVSGATSIEQQIVDNIANALGISGTGHSVATVSTALGAIPGGNIIGSVAASLISGVTSTEQQITDAVYQAINGGSSVGNAVSTIKTGLTTVAGNASNAVGQLTDAADNVLNVASGDLTAATTTLGNALAGAFATLQNALTGGSSAAASPAAAASSLVQQVSILSSVNSQVGGTTGLSVSSVNQALQRSSIGSGAGTSGVFATVDFATHANQSTLSGMFTPCSGSPGVGGTKVTKIGVTSGAAAWQLPGSSATWDWECYPTPSTSDYQVVSMVLGAANDLGNASGGPTQYLIGRSNAAMTTCVYAEIGEGPFASLHCMVGGTDTQFATAAHTPVIGGVYELALGNEIAGNPYTFQLLCNGVPVVTYTDTSHVSQVGSSYRYAGFGMQWGTSSSHPVPATVSQWGLADNAPPSVIGSGFRQYRSNTAGVSISTTGTPTLLPNSLFDTNQWLTADLTSAPATANKVTVSIPGWYMVTICYRILTGGVHLWPVLYHNGSAVQQGNLVPEVGSNYNAPAQSTFLVYCAAGDTLQPGIFVSSSTSIYGEATGSYSYWEVALVNCGTLS